MTEKTTHLVAIRKGTAKANAAKKDVNIKIVNPEWLWTCAERWEHVDERLFPVTSQVQILQFYIVLSRVAQFYDVAVHDVCTILALIINRSIAGSWIESTATTLQ